ncbi:lasso peptide biosynthesis B2 protein [Ancylobacter sp.]|uniref:lasso peptide biosynthesis B2 protein n=1 Tax=Ancylobacter sp. TaxID=1872567 RepID=UPI003D09DF2A
MALLAQALFILACARLAIVALPFRKVAWIASARPSRPFPADPLAQIRRVRWAIRAVARRMPFRALCLEQGLAARILLRWRGIPTTLYYGVAKDENGKLIAHLWARADGIDVIGTEGLERFTLLCTFAPAHSHGASDGPGGEN